ncbi:MAG: hypothetical protein HKN04_14420, partial [Rhodothermaceae bacterium]|nr:hypothetical protein [Rhodothermaceae bacterium]
RGEENVYRISFELKSTAKGEGRPARGAINDAVTQALRGLNGLIELSSEWSETGRVLIQPVAPAYGSGRYAAFMPVVLTTATIWTSSTDISMADLESGNLTKDQIDLKKEPWIYFHYPQSPDLRHNLKVTGPRRTIDEVLYRDYTRTVCIVSTNGLADFLSHWESCDKWLDE